MIFGYVMTLVFLVIMIVFQYFDIAELLYSLIFLMFKCGNQLTFLSVFIIHTDLFGIQFLATSYGICNIVSRLITLIAPIVAEWENKLIPLLLLVIFNVASLISTIFIRLTKRGK